MDQRKDDDGYPLGPMGDPSGGSQGSLGGGGGTSTGSLLSETLLVPGLLPKYCQAYFGVEILLTWL